MGLKNKISLAHMDEQWSFSMGFYDILGHKLLRVIEESHILR